MSDKPTEIKVGTPTKFDGNPNDASRWLYSLIAYISLNDRIYSSPEKKIILTLSFMNKGTAATWEEAAYEKAADNENFGSWEQFQLDFKRTTPKKKKISQKEILNVLKTCFDNEEEEEKDGETDEEIPISKMSFSHSSF
ncbi:hypothetical protein PAXRUDRAFT_10607 [Paxillus rubicundulus Ve08.2h10]|uniref:Retrotransposon gag domain-containing protein n=1 Tax=Paxillus rubicundulus Ve08.2h10 TaxID=930991 RepID=A0A0D0EAP2_9AGAM|nr:hypothetical protein PAXRUDRAFT_10607 [Paxillus rubicundulus Ve08.2h10]